MNPAAKVMNTVVRTLDFQIEIKYNNTIIKTITDKWWYSLYVLFANLLLLRQQTYR